MPNHPSGILDDDPAARVLFTRAARDVPKQGMFWIGMEAPEAM